MLRLTLKYGQKLRIGHDVVIWFEKDPGAEEPPIRYVRVMVEAPKRVSVVRGELV